MQTKHTFTQRMVIGQSTAGRLSLTRERGRRHCYVHGRNFNILYTLYRIKFTLDICKINMRSLELNQFYTSEHEALLLAYMTAGVTELVKL